MYRGKVDTWDYQWTFACWIQNALTIIPNVNLVSNIGFGSKAVHTKAKDKFAEMDAKPMMFPISNPDYILLNSNADFFVENKMFSGKSLILRVINKLKGSF